MADKKELLIDVKVDTGAVAEIAKYSEKLRELRTEQESLEKQIKGLNKTDVDYKEQLGKLQRQLTANNETQKAYRKEINEVSRGLQNDIIQTNKYEGTLKGLTAQLSRAKDELRAMSLADPNWSKKAQEVYELNEKVKQLEQSYGVYTRNVGNYANSIRDAFKNAGGGISGISAALKVGAAPIMAAITAVGGFARSLMNAYKTSIDFEQANKNLQTILGVSNDAMQGLTDTALELGRTTEYTASQVTDLQTELAKLGFTIPEIQSMQKAVLSLATDLNANLADASALTGATLRAFGADASEASHYIDVLVAGANKSALSFSAYQTALAQIAPVASKFGFSIEDTTALLGTLANAGFDASTAATSLRNILTKMASPDSKLSKALDEPVKDVESLIKGMKQLQDEGIDLAEAFEFVGARGMTALLQLTSDNEGLGKLREQLNDVNGLAIEIQEERLNTTEGAIKTLQSAWEGFVLAITGSKGKLAATINWLARSINQITDKLDPEGAAARKRRDRVAWYEGDMGEYVSQYSANGLDPTKGATSQYEWQKGQIQQQKNSAQKDYVYIMRELARTDLPRRERKNLESWQAYYTQKLAEIDDEFAILDEAYANVMSSLAGKASTGGGSPTGGDSPTGNTAANKAAKSDTAAAAALQKMFGDIRKNALGGSVAYETEQIETRYKAMYEALDEMVKENSITNEEATYYKVQLASKMQTELEQINRKEVSANVESQAEIIKTTEEIYNEQMQLAWNNADEQYRIRKSYLEQQLQDETLTAAERAAIEEQLFQNEQQHNIQRAESFAEYAGKVMTLISQISTISENLNERELQSYKGNQDKQRKELKRRLDQGLINEENYNNSIAVLDEQLDAKKAVIARKQAERQRKVSIFEIAVNTATAIIKAFAELGPIAGGVSSALIGATAAAQTAAVLSQPLPQARKGGLVQGAKHEQGGVLINTEGGERIVGANPSKAFPELLNLISYIGKHGMPDTGYGTRAAITGNTAYNQAAQGSTDTLADRIAVAVQQQPIYVNMTEMRDYENRHADIVEAAKM